VSRKFLVALSILVILAPSLCVKSGLVDINVPEGMAADQAYQVGTIKSKSLISRVHNIDTRLNYTTIQEAIDANETLYGHSILVDAGTYYESVVVNKSLSLVGESKNITVIDGNRTGDTMYITANNVTVSGFTIINSLNSGIALSSNGNTINRTTIIASDGAGISIDRSYNNSISENNITSTQTAIDVLSSSGNNITQNNFANSSFLGVGLYGSSNNSVINNAFYNNGLYVADSYKNVISGNTVNSKPLVYLENVSSYDVIDAGQVVLVNCNNINVENLRLSNASYGLELWGTNNSRISSNSIANNVYGIGLYHSSYNNSITGNNITANSWFGVELRQATYNNVSGNSILANDLTGISVSARSDYNSFLGNNLSTGRYGLSLLQSSNNSIRSNIISNNTYNFIVTPTFSNLTDFVNNVDTSNTVDGKPIYYWVNRREGSVPAGAGYVALINCTNILVQNLNLTKNGQGVLLAYTSNCTLTKNYIVAHRYDGIDLFASFNNSISGNSISRNQFGIYAQASSNNRIFGNNLIGNTAHCENSTNAWDDGYPSGGNYWSDYDGSDVYSGVYQNETGYDWIGDIPYVIDQNNADEYPLTQQSASGTDEIRLAYRNLLGEYNRLLMDFGTLNATYQQGLSDYSELQDNYTALQNNYDSLQANFTVQNSTYNDLQRKYNSIQGELGSTRNLVYVLTATTVILIAATVYLARRKPKSVRPRAKPKTEQA